MLAREIPQGVGSGYEGHLGLKGRRHISIVKYVMKPTDHDQFFPLALYHRPDRRSSCLLDLPLSERIFSYTETLKAKSDISIKYQDPVCSPPFIYDRRLMSAVVLERVFPLDFPLPRKRSVPANPNSSLS